MTVEGLVMDAGRTGFGMVARNNIFMMRNSIMKIGFGCNADSKNYQQYKSYYFLYECLLFQMNAKPLLAIFSPVIKSKIRQLQQSCKNYSKQPLPNS
jgi:hypothetical protein